MIRFITVLAGFAILFNGCAYLSTLNGKKESDAEHKTDQVDSVAYGNLPFDPMSLGPSVFAVNTVRIESPDAAEMEPAVQARGFGYRVQLGAFIDQALAEKLAEQAKADLNEPSYVVFDRPFYRVRIGNCPDIKTAEALKAVAISQGYQDARIAVDSIEETGD